MLTNCGPPLVTPPPFEEDTPRLMLSYRPSARAPYFGIFGMVEVPGSVSVGDHVEIVNEPAQR